eukprot:TRINITY_DN4384_c0_g3_i1.p1 TRINITY_DN4384_c0_g3~~TRINITY_DN4384_c0_g3_i1.p1  ORF type:complete len:881 (+),score=81.81 TRINITY_DN4384_c0_g3_i1:160-2802(+)
MLMRQYKDSYPTLPLDQESYFFNFVSIGQAKSKALPARPPRNSQVNKAAIYAGLEGHPYIEGTELVLQRDSKTTSALAPNWNIPEEGNGAIGSELESVLQQPSLSTQSEQQPRFQQNKQQEDKGDIDAELLPVPQSQISAPQVCSRANSSFIVAPRLRSLRKISYSAPVSRENLLSPRADPPRPRFSCSFTFGNQQNIEQHAAVSASTKTFGNEYVPRNSSIFNRRLSRSSSAGQAYRQSQEYGLLLGDKWVNGTGGTGTSHSHGSVSRGSSFGPQNSGSVTSTENEEQIVVSTREKYQGDDEDIIATGDNPVEKMKQQLEAMFVNHPEIANRIRDGVCESNPQGFASHTRQLNLRWDVTGALCINQYIMIKKIAEGAFGKVKLCYNTVDRQLYAVKVLYRKTLNKSLNKRHSLRRKNKQLQAVQDPAVQDMLREIAVLKKLEHPNVVKLKEVIDPPSFEDPLMLVMDYLEGGHVVNRIEGTNDRFDALLEDEAREYFRMMCKGLDYLHYNRVVHGDLKPENLLLDGKGELKIADFGCARIKDVDTVLTTTSRYGTPAFRAPEMLTGDNYDPFAADIWALGVCLYCMVFGVLPFRGNILEMYDNIKSQKLTFPDDVEASPELKDLLQRILHKDPIRRALLFDVMCHKWVTEGGQYRLVPILEQTRPPNRVQVTENEQLTAVIEEDYLLKPQFKEISFDDGEYLIKSGDTSNVLYFILSGAVEIKDPVGAGNNKKRTSLTLNPSDALALQSAPEDRNVHDQLYLNVQQTEEVTKRIHESTQDRYREVLLEVKGPANIIGDISICHPIRPFPYNAVARGKVLALELTQDMLQEFLSHIYRQDSFQMQKSQRMDSHNGANSSRMKRSTSSVAIPRNVSFSINA